MLHGFSLFYLSLQHESKQLKLNITTQAPFSVRRAVLFFLAHNCINSEIKYYLCTKPRKQPRLRGNIKFLNE